MPVLATNRTFLAGLGKLLEYPGQDFHAHFDRVLAQSDEMGPEIGAALYSFAQEASQFSVEHAQEMYTRAFDVNPLCVPYLSVHLFGQESFKRAELMTGLKAKYEARGFDYGAELPDHLSVVLQAVSCFSDDEWDELRTYCIEKPLAAMAAALDRAASPWRHVVRAVQRALSIGEEDHA
ncbi:MAG: hypothetical protein AMXMBFR4_01230 [Candidatus Hydrogenedentota bacterium]